MFTVHFNNFFYFFLIQVERRSRIREVCKLGYVGHHQVPRDIHFIGDMASGNLTICVAPKTGTTSLEDFMFKNINQKDKVDFQTKCSGVL